MVWYVSRQNYWPDGDLFVEIARGGGDYANPGMLISEYPGEGEEYDDPREAVEAALTIRDLWKKDQPEEEIQVGHGATGGWTMPFEGSEDDELKAWAEKEYAGLEKCARCGKVLSDNAKDWIQIYEPPYGGQDGTLMNDYMELKEYYCSEECGDAAYEEAYKYWAESERDDWLAQIDDPANASVHIVDTRPGRYDLYAELDDEGETLYRQSPTAGNQLEIDLAELLNDEHGIWYENAMKVIDHAREVFTLEAPVVEIGG